MQRDKPGRSGGELHVPASVCMYDVDPELTCALKP